MRRYPIPPRPLALLVTVFVTVFVTVLLAAGCAATRPDAETDVITVEGNVMALGHEPFSAYVLETDGHNSYVLVLDDTLRRDFITPAYIRATGKVYRGEWMSRPYAHLRVRSWVRVPEEERLGAGR